MESPRINNPCPKAQLRIYVLRKIITLCELANRQADGAMLDWLTRLAGDIYNETGYGGEATKIQLTNYTKNAKRLMDKDKIDALSLHSPCQQPKGGMSGYKYPYRS